MKPWMFLVVAAAVGVAPGAVAAVRPAAQPEPQTAVSRPGAEVRLALSRQKEWFEDGDLGTTQDAVQSLHMRRAAVLEKQGHDERAIAEYDRLLNFYPNFYFALSGRARINLKLRRFDDALGDFTKAVDAASADWLDAALSDRCFARAVAGKELEAGLADCNRALEIDPHEANNIAARGFLYFRMGNLTAAAADLDKAVSLQPDNADALFARGLLRKAQGDKAGGDADIATAEKFDSKIADTYAAYGLVP